MEFAEAQENNHLPRDVNGEQLLRQESTALNVLSVLIEQFLRDTMI